MCSWAEGHSSSTQRFEFKYRLDVKTYHRVRCALRYATRHDVFSSRGRRNRYLVRSLYFDTFGYDAYEEKVTGVPNRTKLRIRSYWGRRDDAEFVALELKTKSANLVDKFTKRVSLGEYDRFMASGAPLENSDPTVEEFCRLMLLKDLRPKVLVEYEREALTPIDGSGVRITFDHDMRFAFAQELFPRRAFFHRARPHAVVMEIKTRQSRPKWLESIIRGHELPSRPNSKYAWGIEQSQHAMFV